MEPFKIMVVDDEEAMRESLSAWLRKDGHIVETAASGQEALSRLPDAGYDLLLCDIKMPGMDGLELLQKVKARHPDILIIMITAYASIESSVQAMKLGASDYLIKPFDPEQLMLLIEKMASTKSIMDENIFLRERLAEVEEGIFEDLIGTSPAMREVFAMIEDVAPTDTPVLINGETGTGKELIARALHARSGRAFSPFVIINCGAQTETILESELFGHERGAFTGAVKTRRGRLEMANTGTLFLDEVGEIPLKMQVDLLRVLEEKKFHRVGGNQEVHSDFRLICATHRDLAKRIQESRFRQDFYYRINVITINEPPLRERVEDNSLLADHFLNRYALETGKKINGISNGALSILETYNWPGNVRELKNVMERAVVICRNDHIGTEELTFLKPRGQTGPADMSLKDVEIAHIKRTLTAHNWNITKTADSLKIDRVTLSRKMKRYGIIKPEK
jgi:DNA-binding NtrC family response regulator